MKQIATFSHVLLPLGLGLGFSCPALGLGLGFSCPATPHPSTASQWWEQGSHFNADGAGASSTPIYDVTNIAPYLYLWHAINHAIARLCAHIRTLYIRYLSLPLLPVKTLQTCHSSHGFFAGPVLSSCQGRLKRTRCTYSYDSYITLHPNHYHANSDHPTGI